jgi:hypothetical protein
MRNICWQRDAGKRALRLVVIAPTRYRKCKSRRLYYRDPAYLLPTDISSSLKQLLQIYFDRWQIEVNHREEKDTLGVGQAQLWNVTSVPKQNQYLRSLPTVLYRSLLSKHLVQSVVPSTLNCLNGATTHADLSAWT